MAQAIAKDVTGLYTRTSITAHGAEGDSVDRAEYALTVVIAGSFGISARTETSMTDKAGPRNFHYADVETRKTPHGIIAITDYGQGAYLRFHLQVMGANGAASVFNRLNQEKGERDIRVALFQMTAWSGGWQLYKEMFAIVDELIERIENEISSQE